MTDWHLTFFSGVANDFWAAAVPEEATIAVRGVDISADNVERLQRAAAARGVEVDAIVGDVRGLAPAFEADGAFWFGNGFGYLPPAGLAEALDAVAGSLRPRARFALDTSLSAESVLPGLDLEQPSEHEAGGIVLRATRRYDVSESRIDTTYEFTRGDEVTARDASYWVMTTREIRGVLEGAHLDVVSMTADLDGAQFRPGCRRLLVLAEKG